MQAALLLLAVPLSFPGLAPGVIAQGVGPSARPLAPRTPRLAHTAPELGATLTIRITGAPPRARVELYYSPERGSLATRYGTLELGPMGLVRAGRGNADQGGRIAFDFDVPLDAARAEEGAHFQAFVAEPRSPNGAVLSNAAHLRLLGSRLYVGLVEESAGAGDRLLVRSIVRDEDLFVVPVMPRGGGVVFSNDRALGAVLTRVGMFGSRISVFDNFTGEVLRDLPIAGVPGPLLLDAEGAACIGIASDNFFRMLFRRSQLATGETTTVAAFNGPFCFRFVANAPRTEGYMATCDFEAEIIRLDLRPGGEGVLERTTVGLPGDPGVLQVAYAGGLVLAVSGEEGPSDPRTLSRLDYSTSPPTLSTSAIGTTGLDGLLAVPQADAVLTWVDSDFGATPFSMRRTSLSSGGASALLLSPSPPTGASFVDLSPAAAIQGQSVWFFDACCQEPPGADEPGGLWRLDAAAGTWTGPTNVFPGGATDLHGPRGLALAEDPFQSRLFAAMDAGGSPVGQALVRVIDPATAAESDQPYTLSASPGHTGLFHVEIVP